MPGFMRPGSLASKDRYEGQRGTIVRRTVVAKGQRKRRRGHGSVGKVANTIETKTEGLRRGRLANRCDHGDGLSKACCLCCSVARMELAAGVEAQVRAWTKGPSWAARLDGVEIDSKEK